jgi:hypothetical protein
MDPTLHVEGPGGNDVPAAEPVPAVERVALSKRVELVAALLAGVVALELLALIIGASGGGPYRTFGDRFEVVSLNLDSRTALILLVAAMLATLRDTVTADFDTPRSDVGRRTLFAVVGLGVLIAVLALVGVGIDISKGDVPSFGTNAAAAVVHRLAVVLMAGTAAGWALTALGIRITTLPRR